MQRIDELQKTLNENLHGDNLEKYTMDGAINHRIAQLVLVSKGFSSEQCQRPDGTTKVMVV